LLHLLTSWQEAKVSRMSGSVEVDFRRTVTQINQNFFRNDDPFLERFATARTARFEILKFFTTITAVQPIWRTHDEQQRRLVELQSKAVRKNFAVGNIVSIAPEVRPLESGAFEFYVSSAPKEPRQILSYPDNPTADHYRRAHTK
jgi:hypothetical protein